MRSSRIRNFVLAATMTACSVLVVIIAAEIVLHFFPVEMSPRTVPLNASNPVLRAPPNTRFSHSVGWTFRHPNSGRINNDGFFNDQDYRREGPRPLIAVIGDSYIEAKMVPYESTVQGRLAKNLKPGGRVYSFAMSGAPLSQYLAWLSYAQDAYAPDAAIITVVGNDFDESHIKYAIRDGFYHYTEDKDGTLRLRMTEYDPSLLRTLALKSALVRYLFFHLHVRQTWATLRNQALQVLVADDRLDGPRYVGNTLATVDEDRRALAVAVVDAFLHDLPRYSDLAPERVLFVVDGLRSSIYDPAKETKEARSFFALMRRYLIEKAVQAGYAVIDLHEVFRADYHKHGRRFEFDVDGHWSAYGHGVVAGAIMRSQWYSNVPKIE